MGVKLNHKKIYPIILCLVFSLFLCGCPTNETSSVTETDITSSSTSVTNTEQTSTEQTTSSYNVRAESSLPNNLIVQVLSSHEGGDSIVLRYGNTEILIDTALGDTTKEAVRKIIEEDNDHTWEYVIFTHPDNDHIGKAKELFETFEANQWKVKHVIDFGIDDTNTQEDAKEKQILSDYKALINGLNNVEYYTPNGNLSKEKLTQVFEIDQHFKLSVLYNEDYNAKIDNEQSVCCLFQLDNQKLLFTGDLQRDGERYLINNHRELLKNVTFFKAGHHGSNTSNTQEFVDWIRPAYVAITYNHKRVENEMLGSISRFLKYTDYIYPTIVKDIYDEQKSSELFGECKFVFNGKQVEVESVQGKDSTVKTALLNGSSWYWDMVGASRISDEINTYFFDENIFIDNKTGNKDTQDKNGSLSYYNCTLVKYGHYDILIDCGSSDNDSEILLNKLKDYVVDGVIECVVVSHFHMQNYTQLIGATIHDGECVFEQFKIERIIDNDSSMTNSNSSEGTFFSIYLSKAQVASERTSIKNNDQPIDISICDGLKVTVYRGNNAKQHANEDDFSLVTVVDYYGSKMVFVGDLTDYSWFNDEYLDKLKSVFLVRFPSSYVDYNKMKGIDTFFRYTKPKVIMIGSPINHWNNNQYFIKNDNVSSFVDFLINCSGNRDLKVYSSGYVDNNVTKSVAGDIDFSLFIKERIIDDKPQSFYVSCCFNGGKGNSSKLNNSYYAYVPDDIRLFPDSK